MKLRLSIYRLMTCMRSCAHDVRMRSNLVHTSHVIRFSIMYIAQQQASCCVIVWCSVFVRAAISPAAVRKPITYTKQNRNHPQRLHAGPGMQNRISQTFSPLSSFSMSSSPSHSISPRAHWAAMSAASSIAVASFSFGRKVLYLAVEPGLQRLATHALF